MEYNAEGNFEENNNNDNNELYILSNDDTKENNNNIFEVRENAFTRNEKNYNNSDTDMEINFIDANGKNKFINLSNFNNNDNIDNNDNEIVKEYTDSNYWNTITVQTPKNLDFLNDL